MMMDLVHVDMADFRPDSGFDGHVRVGVVAAEIAANVRPEVVVAHRHRQAQIVVVAGSHAVTVEDFNGDQHGVPAALIQFDRLADDRRRTMRLHCGDVGRVRCADTYHRGRRARAEAGIARARRVCSRCDRSGSG
jgi:hypothetical protein